MTYRLWLGNLDGGAAEEHYAVDWLRTMRKRGYNNIRIEPAPGVEPSFPVGDDDSERGLEAYEGEDDADEDDWGEVEQDPSEIRPLPMPRDAVAFRWHEINLPAAPTVMVTGRPMRGRATARYAAAPASSTTISRIELRDY